MAKENEEPKKRTKTEKRFLKYQFTHDEIHEKGILLATLTSEMTAIENEKKAIVSEFKAKLDGKQATVELIGNHINNGYEHRYIDCKVIFDDPSIGLKTTYRQDTGEKVQTDPMTADELQLPIEFE